MGKVYIVQELTRYHCPECDGTYSSRAKGGFRCSGCGHTYSEGIQKPTVDLTTASIYGELEVLIKMNHIGIAVQPVISMLRPKLKSFSDDDYILPTGDPVAIGIVTFLAAEANRGRVNMLRWDRQTRSYIKIPISLRG
jgi:hypothetical protein